MPALLKWILTPLLHLGKLWIDSKTESHQFEQQVRLKVLEQQETAMKYTQLRMAQSWTDDGCVAWVLVFLTCCFIPDAQTYIKHGLTVIADLPTWLQYVITGAFTSSLGISAFSKYRRIK